MPKVTGQISTSLPKRAELPSGISLADTGLWVRKRINVVKDDGGLHPVDARVMGLLAIHPSITGTDHYTVSHARMGRCLTYVRREADAMRIVEELLGDREVVVALGKGERAVLIEAMPKWVLPWLGACREARRHVPSDKYKEANYAKG